MISDKMREIVKKRYWIIGTGAATALIVGTVIFSKVNVLVNKNEEGTAVTMIVGADNPTSEILDGKLDGGNNMAEYNSISMTEAKEIFAEAGDYVILDVRRADEFAEGHIPGAINVANEDIGLEQPVVLPDMNMVIYVYCRSGRRSKEAASKLVTIGYRNIIECGGILDWTGDIEK